MKTKWRRSKIRVTEITDYKIYYLAYERNNVGTVELFGATSVFRIFAF